MTSTSTFSLADKVVIQFGGTGHLGRVLTDSPGATGADLVVCSRDAGRLESQAAGERATGRRVSIDECDSAGPDLTPVPPPRMDPPPGNNRDRR